MQTQSVVVFSIIAAVISFISLIITIVNCVILVKNYKKSKKLEFFQRRDFLSQKISELNVKNSETHLISARYQMVVQNLSTLRLPKEQAERINKQIASIEELREQTEQRAKLRDEIINWLHSLCSTLKLETRATEIEKLIALIQGVTDNAKRSNEISLGVLHVFESTEPLMKADLDKIHKYEMQLAELDSVAKELNEKAHQRN
jgi:methyl-accepting chemotaxis protein